MKRTLILSFVLVFTLGLFAPVIVKAMDNSTVIVNVQTEEKKVEKKADEKTAVCTDAKKAECTDAKKAECTNAKSTEAKPCCASKKAESTEKK